MDPLFSEKVLQAKASRFLVELNLTLGAGITEINEFSTIFTGLFQAKVSGEYALGSLLKTTGAFWLDLDQDGNFETVGDRGGEHMNGSFAPGFSYVVLQPASINSPLHIRKC